MGTSDSKHHNHWKKEARGVLAVVLLVATCLMTPGSSLWGAQQAGTSGEEQRTELAPRALKRDIFAPPASLRGTKRVLTARGTAGEVVKGLELTATLVDDRGAVALIGDQVLGVGDSVKGLRVTGIKNNEVTLSKGKRKFVLRMKEE